MGQSRPTALQARDNTARKHRPSMLHGKQESSPAADTTLRAPGTRTHRTRPNNSTPSPALRTSSSLAPAPHLSRRLHLAHRRPLGVRAQQHRPLLPQRLSPALYARRAALLRHCRHPCRPCHQRCFEQPPPPYYQPQDSVPAVRAVQAVRAVRCQ